MKALKVMLLSLLYLSILAHSTCVFAQKAVMMAYVQDGGQTLWYEANHDTRVQFEQRVELCHQDLKQFFFLKQLAPKTGVAVVETDAATGMWRANSKESKDSKEIWIAFYGRNDKDTAGLPTNFSYLPGQKTLYAPRVEMSRAWFCSRMIHELGHVRYHVLLKAESATAEMGSPSWLSEEVATHEYERAALDFYTDKAYTNALLEILEKYNPGSMKELLQRIKKDDLELLDNLFTKDASTLERGIRGPAFLINLSILLAERLKRDPSVLYGEVRNFILESRKP